MNILFIGAHFDDLELGCGGAIKKFSANGDKVYSFIATTSGYDNHDGAKIRDSHVAYEEGKKASVILGSTLICGKHITKNLVCTSELIEEINAIIDKVKADVIFTHWDGDVQQDHRNLSLATLTAARHIPRLFMYRCNWYVSTQDFSGNYYIDISEQIEYKITALKEYVSEYKRRGEEWINFFIDQNRVWGRLIGVKYAEEFKVVKYLS